jgi:hypothetical protein
MRIRSIKPEFWRSDDIASLSWADRLLFIGLWSYVDDNGVGRDVDKLIVADLFPLEDDPRDTLATVSRGLSNLSAAGLIERYDVDRKPYLHIASWDNHQRIDKPNKARYPLPTCGNAVPRDTPATPSRDTLDIPAPGAVEQRNRGTREQGRQTRRTQPASEDVEFDLFWAAYPRRDAKGTARAAWAKAVRKADPTAIITAAQSYADDPNREPGFTALPASWLNAERWEDGPLPARHTNGRSLDPQADLLRAEMARAQAADAAHETQNPRLRQIGA